MGMTKIPIRMSWEKVTWYGKKEKKVKTISKDNKWLILSLHKLKEDKLFSLGI